MENYFHVDPINLLAMIGSMVVVWTTMRNRVLQHSEWIEKHEKECMDVRKETNRILVELQISNAHLATLVENLKERL